MHGAAQEALRTINELNTGYRSPEEVRALLSRLTGKTVDESVALFPPFYSEFGKNLTLGKEVFINLGCRFQDTGGITIGDGSLIGHGSTLTTLDHAIDPDRRADMHPGSNRDRPQGVARSRSDGRPRRHHRRRRDRGRRRRGDQGRAGQRHRRRRTSQTHPHDWVRRRPELTPCRPLPSACRATAPRVNWAE